jgi:hypothetical protein
MIVRDVLINGQKMVIVLRAPDRLVPFYLFVLCV